MQILIIFKLLAKIEIHVKSLKLNYIKFKENHPIWVKSLTSIFKIFLYCVYYLLCDYITIPIESIIVNPFEEMTVFFTKIFLKKLIILINNFINYLNS